jgi:hypothetical protein
MTNCRQEHTPQKATSTLERLAHGIFPTNHSLYFACPSL